MDKFSRVDKDAIKLMVNAFHAKVFKYETLKPIIEQAIGASDDDLAPHLQVMYDFWSSIMLTSGRYHGNPMMKHAALPEFDEAFFDFWLALFMETARELHAEEVALIYAKKASRIAQSLSFGLFYRSCLSAQLMLEQGYDGKKRCFGNRPGHEFYAQYHDEEWGVPEHDDQKLFEMLILEGAQAGLSWETILKRREGYRRVFLGFDVQKLADLSDDELLEMLQDSGIIRHRLKVFSVRTNARVFLNIQQEFGSFDAYLWRYVDHCPIRNIWQAAAEVPARTPLSDQLSKDLKKRGMSFVGSTIIYAYMQATGMVNDHLADCWCTTEQNG